MNTPSVVAAIVNHNGADRTIRTLDSLEEHSPGTAFTPLVVDNGSAFADFGRLAASVAGRSALLRLPRNRGYAAAGNAAIRWASERGADYLWLLNNDLSLQPGALQRLLDALASDRQAAAAVPVTLSVTAPHAVLSAGVELNLWLGTVRHRYAGQPASQLGSMVEAVPAVEGSALLIRLAAVERVGALNEDFFMYWEDTEWSVRCRRAGYRLLVVPAARVFHEEGASSLPVHRVTAILANRVRFMSRCASPIQRAVFYVYFFGVWLPVYTALRLIPRYGLTATLRCWKEVLVRRRVNAA